ncbi:hypothetical protein T484DRAFT_1925182 [Baffinella frigidus]|nr:hypothetical protein T484DRAFT_1925182 [Cryptophyta sp. CCMP2293]
MFRPHQRSTYLSQATQLPQAFPVQPPTCVDIGISHCCPEDAASLHAALRVFLRHPGLHYDLTVGSKDNEINTPALSRA